MTDTNIVIEKVDLHSDRHGDYITFYFDKNGEKIKRQIKQWCVLSALNEYEAKYFRAADGSGCKPNMTETAH